MVEGAKGVQELLGSSFEAVLVVATEDFLSAHSTAIARSKAETVVAKPAELAQMGSFQSNDAALAIARMRDNREPVLKPGEFALVLDDIRDPGNLGTMIRTADWYGLKHVIASEETADLYNPKVISATMGSFTRIGVYYTDLIQYVGKSAITSFGAFLDGEDVHQADFEGGGLIVIGNESSGISPSLARLIKRRITIPRIGEAESLNASVAAAVVLDNIMRAKS